MNGSGDRLEGRRLYLCTPDRPDLAEFVAACIEGGVDVVQLREKHLEARQLILRARMVAHVCRSAGVPFLVNDRPDLAVAAGADGVHVGQDDCPPQVARRIMGPDALVGLSTHKPEELAEAASEPVDYVSAGPVTPTPTKPGRPGVGLGYVTHAVSSAGRPVFVTGGVAPDTVPAIAAAGATRFVVVRWLTEAADPLAAARALRRAVDDAVS
ncbi:MAG TPA: thiamine phosphate synthase [Acidimicrobiales bacterium]|nr:thiamine phosphate synthase [Acidimicrobiales bacterium]